jgi:hypothetical protein
MQRPVPCASARLAILLTTVLIAGCQTIQGTVQAQRKVDIQQDRLRLMVYTTDLGVPYQKLGDLSYTDPLNGETIDTDHINEKLRQIAIARWGQQVDAIIHVATKVGGGDTATISVTAEAVRMMDPCSGCRHNQPSPDA